MMTKTKTARYERRNARRRKVHLTNGDTRPACGAAGSNLPLSAFAPEITCETCRVLAAKGV